MLRNSMGACAMVRMGRSTRGRGRGFYPVTYGSPPPRYMYQTSPTMPTGSATPAASPQFYQTTPTTAYFDAASPKRSGEEQMNVPALVEVAHPSTAGMTIKSTKNSVQILEEICQKSNWGQPIYTLHSTTATNPDEEPLYLYKVMVPGLSMTYIPAKLTRSVEEAKTIAAEYSLVQLGYPMEAASYTPARPLHYPEVPMCAANFVAVQSSPKPATWATLGTVDPTTAAVAAAATAIYPAPGYTPENPFPTPQAYAHPQEYYQQGF